MLLRGTCSRSRWLRVRLTTHPHKPSQPTHSGWYVIRGLSHGGYNGESGRWPGPLLTVLDARECHSHRGGQHRADSQHATLPCEGRRCVSEPASSQPGESSRDYPRRNLRPSARRGGQLSRLHFPDSTVGGHPARAESAAYPAGESPANGAWNSNLIFRGYGGMAEARRRARIGGCHPPQGIPTSTVPCRTTCGSY
jgi:hypothetical protein